MSPHCSAPAALFLCRYAWITGKKDHEPLLFREPMRILIVDDNANDRLILRSILEFHGCAVMEAQDGKEGLDLALRQRPELIISDALMPGVDGYQFLKALREHRGMDDIPFVFYTAVYTGKKESDLARSLGAAAFWTKPVGADELWRRISELSGQRGSLQGPAGAPETVKYQEFLEQYSSVVAGKLEEKVRDLEREVNDRKTAEETVTRQREELRALAARLAEAEEKERGRIARELHDQVGQNLTALGINLNLVLSQLPGPAEAKLCGRIEDSLELVERTTAMVRTLMMELRPPVLDDYGLAAAVEWYARQFQDSTGIPLSVRKDDRFPRFDPLREIGMFRIVQEALTNVAKHARAKQVTVSLDREGGRCRVIVADDGIGFEPDRARRPESGPAWGILNMMERARTAGGECTIESRPGQGTRVVLEVPA